MGVYGHSSGQASRWGATVGTDLTPMDPSGGRTRGREGRKAKAQARPPSHTGTYIEAKPTLNYGREQSPFFVNTPFS